MRDTDTKERRLEGEEPAENTGKRGSFGSLQGVRETKLGNGFLSSETQEDGR